MKLGDLEDVKAQLTGKTGLLPEYEEVLMEKIASIEADGEITGPLAKIDLALIIGLITLCLITTAICFSWA